MEFNTYQEFASSTALYTDPIVYPALGLAGESGEVAEKVKKLLRGDKGREVTEEFKKSVAMELGDVLWYVSQVAKDIDYKLEDIARLNIEKLSNRQKKGTLKGSGDNR